MDYVIHRGLFMIIHQNFVLRSQIIQEDYLLRSIIRIIYYGYHIHSVWSEQFGFYTG